MEFMKIVKEGVTVGFDCKSCGCLFRVGIHIVRTPDNGENYYAECPMCGSECHADVVARDSNKRTNEEIEHQYGCFELKSETAIYFTEDQFDLILKWMESTGSETIQDAIIQAIYRASIQGKLSLFNEQPTHNQ